MNEDLLLQDLAEEYYNHCEMEGMTKKTMINKRQEINQLLTFLKEKRGVVRLGQFDVHSLRAYRKEKDRKGLQPNSITSMFKMIRAWNNWMVEKGYVTENVAKQIPLPKKQKKMMKGFTLDEVKRMIDVYGYSDYISARNKAIITMMAETGLRSIELRTLKPHNVDRRAGRILLDGKGQKQRYVGISKPLNDVLIKYERVAKKHWEGKEVESYYFLSYKGEMLSHTGLWNMIRGVGKKAKIEDKRLSPHTFRHFFAVETLKRENDIFKLSKYLGHEEISTTQKYLKTLDDDYVIQAMANNSPLSSKKDKKIGWG